MPTERLKMELKQNPEKVEKVNAHLKTMLELDWLEEYTEEDYNQMMHEVEEQVEENQRVNGLEKVKQNEYIVPENYAKGRGY